MSAKHALLALLCSGVTTYQGGANLRWLEVLEDEVGQTGTATACGSAVPVDGQTTNTLRQVER